MKRTLKLASLAAVSLAAVSVTFAVASPAAASVDLGRGARSYVLTKTFGPFEGHADLDNVVAEVRCNNALDSILGGKATISRKTSYGTTKTDVLKLEVLGAFYDYEADSLEWGTFVDATGKDGWNAVVISVTCRTTAPKPAS